MSRYLSPHAIRRAMIVKGQSVVSLAFKVGVSPQTIRNLLEGRNTRIATQTRIAQVLSTLPDVVSGDVVDELAERVG